MHVRLVSKILILDRCAARSQLGWEKKKNFYLNFFQSSISSLIFSQFLFLFFLNLVPSSDFGHLPRQALATPLFLEQYFCLLFVFERNKQYQLHSFLIIKFTHVLFNSFVEIPRHQNSVPFSVATFRGTLADRSGGY